MKERQEKGSQNQEHESSKDIGLEQFVEQVKEKHDKGEDLRELNRQIKKSISLSDNYREGHLNDVEFENLNFREGPRKFHLLLSLFPEVTVKETQPILEEALDRVKRQKFNSGELEVGVDVYWNPEAFTKEKKLPDCLKKARVSASGYTANPNYMRAEGRFIDGHELDIEMEDNAMTIKARGVYKRHLGIITDEIKPQFATISLSKKDAKKLIKSIESDSMPDSSKKALTQQLQPKKKTSMSISAGGVYFSEGKQVEITIPVLALSSIEETLGKQIVGVGEEGESTVTEFIKMYPKFPLFKGGILSDLQKTAAIAEKINIGPEGCVITNERAKKLLEAEVAYVNKLVGNEWTFMMPGGTKIISRSVRSLARDLFGQEFEKKIDKLGWSEYINLLQSHGFNFPENTSGSERYMQEYDKKVVQLFEFYKQAYQRNSAPAIEKYRESYTNEKPTTFVTAKTKADARQVGKLQIPSNSRIMSFSLTEWMYSNSGYGNDLSINRSFPDSEEIHFFSRTSTDKPILLPIQEWACSNMGVRFSSL